jgi:transcriptional repressor NrdR
VIDSRSAKEGAAIRRRRQCLECGYRYTTYEEILKNDLRVIKQDGRYEELDRRKLMAGLVKACEKRPVSIDQLERLADQIISTLEQTFEREVPSPEIGNLVMLRLRELDPVAYVRFASVYRQFKDVGEFLKEVQDLTASGGHSEVKPLPDQPLSTNEET